MKLLNTVLNVLVLAPLLGSIACSPAAEPVGKGGAHYQVAFPQDPAVTASCGVTSVGGIGSPTPPSLPSGNLPVTNFGQEVTDGQSIGNTGEYVVDCKVTKGGKIDLEMEGANTSPSKASGSGGTKIEVHGSIGDDGTGTGTVVVLTTESGATTNIPGMPCQLFAVEDQDKPGSYLMGAGEAKFTFLCPQAQSALADFDVCETRGTVVVRDCQEK